jgi:hypothetical protein
MTPFDPILMDDIRQALGLDDQRATEHVWYAMQAFEAAGIEVVLKGAQAPAQQSSVATTSAELTMQILQARYAKGGNKK